MKVLNILEILDSRVWIFKVTLYILVDANDWDYGIQLLTSSEIYYN